jgi:hypothetical protein
VIEYVGKALFGRPARDGRITLWYILKRCVQRTTGGWKQIGQVHWRTVVLAVLGLLTPLITHYYYYYYYYYYYSRR